MKLTIRKTLLFSLALFMLLALAAVAVMFFRVNRTVLIDGFFDYRDSYPVTVDEGGAVREVLVEQDSRVEKGDILVVLFNRELDREIADIEARLAMGALELENIQRQEASALFVASQEVLSSKELLDTKRFEFDYYGSLHEMNQELYRGGSIKKERYEASQLTVRSAQGAMRATEIQLRTSRYKLTELEQNHSSLLALKEMTQDVDRRNLDYLRARSASLLIRAPESGMLLSENWDSLEHTQLVKGTHLADIVSFDDIDFVGFAKDTDIIRVREGQQTYFDVDIFRRKVFVNGKVKNLGLKAVSGPEGLSLFPVTIEINNKKFFDRNSEFFIHAGVRGQAVIIVEEELSLITLVWERVLNFADFGVYTE